MRRCAEAIDLVESKRDADGRWPLENTHPGSSSLRHGGGRRQAEPLEHASCHARARLVRSAGFHDLNPRDSSGMGRDETHGPQGHGFVVLGQLRPNG